MILMEHLMYKLFVFRPWKFVDMERSRGGQWSFISLLHGIEWMTVDECMMILNVNLLHLLQISMVDL